MTTEPPSSEPVSGRVRFTHGELGWYCELDGKQLGPFTRSQLDRLDFDRKVADELGVSPGWVFAARPHQPDPLEVETQNPSPYKRQWFKATASPGPEVPASGFIHFEGGEWAAAEATYLYGPLTITEFPDTKNEKTSTQESLQPVFFYSENGRRGVKLASDAVFHVGSRFLRPGSKTLGSSGPPTLMSLEAGRRFLSGEVINVADLHALALKGEKHFCNLDSDQRIYDVVGCIVIASYFYDVFGVFPILIVLGPFETGKSRLLALVASMGHRGMHITDPTEATIFRTAEAWRGYLCIDEFWKFNDGIERLLRSSYKKGVKVPRIDNSKKGSVTLSLFELFSKTMVGSQVPPPPNIVDKGILIRARKMPDPNPAKRDPTADDFEEFRSRAYMARLSIPGLIRDQADRLDREDLGLGGRDYEVWKPALTIARVLGGQVWENVLSYAKESAEERGQGSYEELRQVLQAIYSVAQTGEKFPLELTPKQLHDLIWDRLKEDYRIVKQKQEIQGEAHEQYDYNTRSFEDIYSPQKIGRTYLAQLGLKRLGHRNNGTAYRLATPLDLHELIKRYHPELQGEKDREKEEYARVLGIQKTLSQPSLLSPDPDSNGKTAAPRSDGSNQGDSITVTEPVTVTRPKPENKRENGQSDSCEGSDGYFGMIKPPFVEVGRCSRCGKSDIPVRPDVRGEFPQCGSCYDELSKGAHAER